MRIAVSKNKEFSLWIIAILFSSQIFSKEMNLVLLYITFLYFLFLNNWKINYKFPGYKIYYYFLITGISIGAFNIVFNSFSLYSFIKHIYYFTIPLLYWIVGYLLVFTKKLSRKQIINSIVLTAVLYSSYDLINVIISLSTSGYNLSAYGLRYVIGTGSYLSVIGLYMYIFYKKDITCEKLNSAFFLCLCLLSFIIHFSRTHILILLILILFSGLRINFKKIIKVFFGFFIVFFIVMILFPELTYSFMLKVNNSINELSYSNKVWNITNIVQNWRGYEMYCEIQQFNASNFFEKLFGAGFGASLDVHGYSYLVTNEPYLLFLHNGYFTQFDDMGDIRSFNLFYLAYNVILLW